MQSQNNINSLFITQDNSHFNQKKFYTNDKQSKTSFNIRDCLPDFNPMSISNKQKKKKIGGSSTTTSLDNSLAKKQYFKTAKNQSIRNSQGQDQIIQDYKKINMEALKNEENLLRNPQIAHKILRSDRKQNQTYLNFPTLKIDNQKMLDQENGERKLKLDSIRTRYNSENSNFNSQKHFYPQQLPENTTSYQNSIHQTRSKFYSDKNDSQTKYSQQFYNNIFTDRSMKQSTKRFIHNKKAQAQTYSQTGYSTAEQFTNSPQFQSTVYEGHLPGDPKNSSQSIIYQQTDYNIDTSQIPISINQSQLDYVQQDQVDSQIQPQKSHLQQSVVLENMHISNQYKEFNENNINVLGQYLSYLGENFNEPYFRARMKGKHNEYCNQKLQLLMNELKITNESERSKYFKKKLKKNIKKLTAVKGMGGKMTQEQKTQKILNNIKKEFDEPENLSPQANNSHQNSKQQQNPQQSQQISVGTPKITEKSKKGYLSPIKANKNKQQSQNFQQSQTQNTEQSDIKANPQLQQIENQIQKSLKKTQQGEKILKNLPRNLIQDLCDNLNKLIRLKGNLLHAGNKLKAINGFNEKIKDLLFDHETLRETYIPSELNQRVLHENDLKLNKKLLYFNKSLEEYLLGKLEDIETDIKNELTKETETITKKCFSLLFKDLPRKQQQELIEIKFGREPKPNYINYTKIANQLERAETKLAMKFEKVTNMNRNDCQHINRIMQVYQHI